jgi:anti-anti-sigma regulatory factor
MPPCVPEDSTMTTFRPADDLGSVLTGRAVAADLRAKVEAELAAGQPVVLDFSNVTMMSPSFGDELFAKLPRSAWDSHQLSVEHLDSSIARFAQFLIASRA